MKKEKIKTSSPDNRRRIETLLDVITKTRDRALAEATKSREAGKNYLITSWCMVAEGMNVVLVEYAKMLNEPFNGPGIWLSRNEAVKILCSSCIFNTPEDEPPDENCQACDLVPYLRDNKLTLSHAIEIAQLRRAAYEEHAKITKDIIPDDFPPIDLREADEKLAHYLKLDWQINQHSSIESMGGEKVE